MKEPLADCVKRELKEETNLEAIEVTYLGVVREFQETYNFIHFVFLCENYNGKLETTEPDKCEGWEWFSLESIPDQTLRGHLAAIDIFKNSSNQLRELL